MFKKTVINGECTYIKVDMTYTILLAALLRVKQKICVFTADGGLCAHIKRELINAGYRGICQSDKALIRILMRSWNEYSGDLSFPIHTSKYISAYRQFHDTKFKFNPFTPYGRARRRLLNHMIKQCRRKIREGNE